MIAAAGSGPLPLHHTSLNQEKLTQAIEYCLKPAARSAASQISYQMKREDGVRTAVQSFHTDLPVEALRCDILPDVVAVWHYSIKDKKKPKNYI
jgi:sterol 3beta-glucosyltransferase